MKLLEKDVERFFAKVEPSKEVKPGLGLCFLWTGATRNGYGHFAMPGGPVYAHRLAWELEHGRPPREGLDVRHRCDDRRCVRASHLVEGTRSENVADAVVQGRHAHGETHGLAKLSDAQVREIRRLRKKGLTQQIIADRFGVSRSYVSMVASKKLRRSA